MYRLVDSWAERTGIRGSDETARRALPRTVLVRAAAGRLVLLYVPTYRPRLNPLALRWRQIRRDVTHGALFGSINAL